MDYILCTHFWGTFSILFHCNVMAQQKGEELLLLPTPSKHPYLPTASPQELKVSWAVTSYGFC